MSTAETITFAVVGFFALCAVLVFVRVLMRRTPVTPFRRYRMGVFVERDDNRPDEPPPAPSRSAPGISETGHDR